MIVKLQNLELDEFLPNKLIQEDLSRILWMENPEEPIELEEKYVMVPHGCPLEVVSKSYRKNFYEIGFGNYYAAQVAVGGVIEEKSGIISPKYCFATLF